MSKPNSLEENEAPIEIYESNFTFKLKLILFTTLAFVVTLFLMLPLEDNINQILQTRLKKNRACPIDYKKADISFFLPSVSLIKPSISGRCFGKRDGSSIPLEKMTVKITIPSFWPPGIKAHVLIKEKTSTVNIYPKLTLLGHDIRLTKTKLSGEFISSFTKFPNLLTGQLNVDAHFKIEGTKVVDGQFKATSKNLRIPAQTLMGFNLIDLYLKRLQLAGTMKGNTVNLQALKIGQSDSPLQSEFKGKINLVTKNMNFSKLDLDGKVRLGDDLLENLSLLKILLQGKKKVKGFYPLKVTGTFASPKPVFLK